MQTQTKHTSHVLVKNCTQPHNLQCAIKLTIRVWYRSPFNRYWYQYMEFVTRSHLYSLCNNKKYIFCCKSKLLYFKFYVIRMFQTPHKIKIKIKPLSASLSPPKTIPTASSLSQSESMKAKDKTTNNNSWANDNSCTTTLMIIIFNSKIYYAWQSKTLSF